MSSLNKVILLGRLGQDPEVKEVGENSLCTLSVATTYKYVNKKGQRVEETEWHRVVVWGRSATYLEKYAKKGTQVMIEGSLKTRNYEDDTGQKKYITEIRASSVSIVSGYANSDDREGDSSQNKKPVKNKKESYKETEFDNHNEDQNALADEEPPNLSEDDDIPF